MNRKSLLLLICLFVFGIANQAPAQVNLTKLVKKVQPAVVTIITYDKSNKVLGLGSGFFVNNKGHLITNYHVLKGASRSEVKTYDGKKYPIKFVIADDKAMDLIKVLVDIPAESVQCVNVSKATPAIAERILVVGSPMGLEQTVSEGIISAIREVPNLGTIYQISAPISSGSSGSPVVNMNAEVVGVATLYLLKGQNLNFAVPGKRIFNLAKKKAKKVRLFVDTEPKGARIRILNIKPKFYKGINLEPGSYHIEVSAVGYEMKKIWIRVNGLNEGEKKLTISLKKRYHRVLTGEKKSGAEAHYNLGLSYDKLGRHSEAIEAYKQAIRIDPDHAGAHTDLGLIYLLNNNYREAIEAFKQVIRINPDSAGAYFRLGVSYYNFDHHTEAVEAYKQAIRINPDYADAHYSLGVSYKKLGRHSEAIEAYKQAIRIDPDDAHFHFSLAVAYGVLGHHTEEIEEFKQVIRINPDDGSAHYCLGLSYGNLGRYTEAIEAFKQAIRINPDSAIALNGLGITYENLGRYTEAIEAHKQAIRINPDYADAHYNLGLSYLSNGNRGAALEEYKILKGLDKDKANKLFNFIYK